MADLIQRAHKLLDNPDATAHELGKMFHEVSAERQHLTSAQSPMRSGDAWAGSMDATVSLIEAERRVELEIEALGRCAAALKQAEQRARHREAVAGFDDARAELVQQADTVAELERQLEQARAGLGALARAFEQRRLVGGAACVVERELAERCADLIHPEPRFGPDQRTYRTTVRRQLAG